MVHVVLLYPPTHHMARANNGKQLFAIGPKESSQEGQQRS